MDEGDAFLVGIFAGLAIVFVLLVVLPLVFA